MSGLFVHLIFIWIMFPAVILLDCLQSQSCSWNLYLILQTYFSSWTSCSSYTLFLIVFSRYLMDGAESSSESEAEQDESEEETPKAVIVLCRLCSCLKKHAKLSVFASRSSFENKKSIVTLLWRVVAIETASSDVLTSWHASSSRKQETHQWC